LQISEETINELLTRVKQVVEPVKVIVFGSAARGLMASDSDIDILVVVSDGTHRLHTCQQIHRHLVGFKIPVDVVVATISDLEKDKDNPGLIYQSILKEGKTVYAA
jgi:predicted nucleotidyltransferase